MAHAAKPEQQAAPFFRRRIVVIAVSVLAMLSAAAAAWMGWRALPEMPVREVVFMNASSTSVAIPFAHLQTAELNRVAQAVEAAKLNALWADLNEVKVVVEQLEWVRHAEVRRRLPDKIEVRIEEHVPFGVWHGIEPPAAKPAALASSADNSANAGASADENSADETVATGGLLINTFGEVFTASLPNMELLVLPVLSGPPASSKEVIVEFDQFRKQLATIERMPREMQLSVRRAWTVKLDNGMTLELGRNDAGQRLQRFTDAYRQIAALQTAGIHVDLRYASGLALRNVARVPNAKAVRVAANLTTPKPGSTDKVSKAGAAKNKTVLPKKKIRKVKPV